MAGSTPRRPAHTSRISMPTMPRRPCCVSVPTMPRRPCCVSMSMVVVATSMSQGPVQRCKLPVHVACPDCGLVRNGLGRPMRPSGLAPLELVRDEHVATDHADRIPCVIDGATRPAAYELMTAPVVGSNPPESVTVRLETATAKMPLSLGAGPIAPGPLGACTSNHEGPPRSHPGEDLVALLSHEPGPDANIRLRMDQLTGMLEPFSRAGAIGVAHVPENHLHHPSFARPNPMTLGDSSTVSNDGPTATDLDFPRVVPKDALLTRDTGRQPGIDVPLGPIVPKIASQLLRPCFGNGTAVVGGQINDGPSQSVLAGRRPRLVERQPQRRPGEKKKNEEILQHESPNFFSSSGIMTKT